MVELTTLWLPILLSAAFVFIVSALIHMALPWHKNDFKSVPSEDEVMEALGKFNISPGDYAIPFAGSYEAMRSEKYKAKLAKGPVAWMTVMETGTPKMGKSLVQWFIYCLIVSIFAAYIASRALTPGAHYLSVFRFAGATAFAGYSLALLQNSIWYRRNWCATVKSVIDGLIYALVTAGTFGWLWPGM